jgi:hypothetical protein
LLLLNTHLKHTQKKAITESSFQKSVSKLICTTKLDFYSVKSLTLLIVEVKPLYNYN